MARRKGPIRLRTFCLLQEEEGKARSCILIKVLLATDSEFRHRVHFADIASLNECISSDL